jgi:hypothetical protein
MDVFKKRVKIDGNDRYAIYRMIGKHVAFANPRLRSSIVEGILEDVSRNIFEDTIELRVRAKVYTFKEPSAILKREGGVILVYGDVKPERGTDEELFAMAKEKGFRENVHEVLKRTAPKKRRDVHIYVLPEEPKVRRRRKERRKK